MLQWQSTILRSWPSARAIRPSQRWPSSSCCWSTTTGGPTVGPAGGVLVRPGGRRHRHQGRGVEVAPGPRHKIRFPNQKPKRFRPDPTRGRSRTRSVGGHSPSVASNMKLISRIRRWLALVMVILAPSKTNTSPAWGTRPKCSTT